MMRLNQRTPIQSTPLWLESVVNKDLDTVSGSAWNIVHGVTDVEQLKPLGVTTAWNESKSMQPSRCAEESGPRDTRSWSLLWLVVHFGGLPRCMRRKMAGNCLTLLVLDCLEVPQMFGSSSTACKLDHGKCDECTSSSVQATPLPGLHVQCQALKISCHILLAQTFPARASLIHPLCVPNEILFPPLSKAPLFPHSICLCYWPQALSEVIHLFENTNLSKNQC